MNTRKYICVFCGSSQNAVKTFGDQVDMLADAIVSEGYGLVYGGANVGLMNRLKERVKQKGGHVIGVITPQVRKWGVVPNDIDLIEKPTDAEREAEMVRLSAAVIALPGGFGTLAELSRMAINNQHASYANSPDNPVKPLVVLNLKVQSKTGKEVGFYDHMQQQIKACHDYTFIADNHLELIDFISSPKDAVSHVKNKKGPEAAPARWWDAKEEPTAPKKSAESIASAFTVKSLCLAGMATTFGVFALRHFFNTSSSVPVETLKLTK